MAYPIIFSSKWSADKVAGFVEKAGIFFGEHYDSFPKTKEKNSEKGFLANVVAFFHPHTEQKIRGINVVFKTAFEKGVQCREKNIVLPSFKQVNAEEEKRAQCRAAYENIKDNNSTYIIIGGQDVSSFAMVYSNNDRSEITDLEDDAAVSTYLREKFEDASQHIDGILMIGSHVERIKEKWPDSVSDDSDITLNSVSTFFTEEEDTAAEQSNAYANKADSMFQKIEKKIEGQELPETGVTKKVFYPALDFKIAPMNGLSPRKDPQVAAFHVTMEKLHDGGFVFVENKKEDQIVVRRFPLSRFITSAFMGSTFDYETEKGSNWNKVAPCTMQVWMNRHQE